MVIQVYAPTSNSEKAKVERFYEDLQDLLELTPKKDVLFIIGDWNAKVGSQETPGVTGNFFFPWSTEWSRAKANRVFPERMHRPKQTPSSSNTREYSRHEHHQMANSEIRFIIFFAAKDGKSLYIQQKLEQELTVAQIMNCLLPNSDLNWKSRENH